MSILEVFIDQALAALWFLWGGFWVFARPRSRPAERREPRHSRFVHIALVACAFSLLFFRPFRIGILRWPVLPPALAMHLSGLGLVALGLAFASWARLHLGQQWSGTVAIRAEQRLVGTGPYAFVRHPIYSGLLLAIIGSVQVTRDCGAWLAVPLAVFAYWRKMRLEEAWLLQKFGQSYEVYRSRVGGLLPVAQRQSLCRSSLARSQGGD